jgi:hypothetical protein
LQRKESFAYADGKGFKGVVLKFLASSAEGNEMPTPAFRR